MRYWCRNCNDEAALAEVPIRLHPFSPPLDYSFCSRCCCEVVEAGKCEYCGEPCDPDADPQLCPACQDDYESLLTDITKRWLVVEGGPYLRTTTKMLEAEETFLSCLAAMAEHRREQITARIQAKRYLEEKERKRNAEFRKAQDDQLNDQNDKH